MRTRSAPARPTSARRWTAVDLCAPAGNQVVDARGRALEQEPERSGSAAAYPGRGEMYRMLNRPPSNRGPHRQRRRGPPCGRIFRFAGTSSMCRGKRSQRPRRELRNPASPNPPICKGKSGRPAWRSASHEARVGGGVCISPDRRRGRDVRTLASAVMASHQPARSSSRRRAGIGEKF
jgi:hypothetical protein